MFHVKRISLVIIVSIISLPAFSQGSITFTDKPFHLNGLKDTAVLNPLLRTEEYIKLSLSEQEVIYWVNYVRSRPKLFLHEVLVPFLKVFPEIRGQYVSSLEKQLSSIKPSPLLKPSLSLYKVAHQHANDIRKRGGKLTHQSSQGENFQERMQRFGYTSCVSENIYQGKEDGLFAVILLLIDSGVPDTGHRKNILAPEMRFIGVSFTPTKKQDQFILVQNFSCN